MATVTVTTPADEATVTDLAFTVEWTLEEDAPPDPPPAETSTTLEFVATRDITRADAGYPGTQSNYVFDRSYLFSTPDPASQATLDTLLVKAAAVPTSDNPAQAFSYDVYKDTLGRIHCLYALQDSSTGYSFTGRHAIVEDGAVVTDVANPVSFPNFTRMFQDSTGRFYIISMGNGTNLRIARATDADTNGTVFGTTTILTVATSFSGGYGPWVTVPRTGTPLDTFVDIFYPASSGAVSRFVRINLATNPPTISSQSEIATGGATGDGGNWWGPNKTRIVRDSTGQVYACHLTGSGFTKTWVMRRRHPSSGNWTTVASGTAGREPPNILVDDNDVVYLIAFPGGTPSIWTSANNFASSTAVSSGWYTSHWPYAGAGINPATGRIVLVQTHGDLLVPGQFRYADRVDGTWSSIKTSSVTAGRSSYAFVFLGVD